LVLTFKYQVTIYITLKILQIIVGKK